MLYNKLSSMTTSKMLKRVSQKFHMCGMSLSVSVWLPLAPDAEEAIHVQVVAVLVHEDVSHEEEEDAVEVAPFAFPLPFFSFCFCLRSSIFA